MIIDKKFLNENRRALIKVESKQKAEGTFQRKKTVL